MPVARFEMPDGRIGRFEVPEGTTPEQAQALIGESLVDQQEEKGFISGVKERLSERHRQGMEIGEAVTTGEQTFPEGMLQMAGKVGAGSVLDVLGEGVAAVGRGAASLVPESVKTSFKEAGQLQRAIDEKSQIKPVTDVATYLPERALPQAISSGSEAYKGFAEEHPRAARNIEATANLAILGAPVKGKQAKTQPTIVGRAAGKVEAAAQSQIAKKRSDFVTDLIRPKQTATIREAQVARTTETGLGPFKKSIIAPSAKEADAISYVTKIQNVSPKNTLQGNYNLISKEISKEAESLMSQLKTRDIPFPRREFRNELKAASQRLSQNPLVTGDAEKTAQRIIVKMEQIMKGKKSTASNLLEARKELDAWMKSQKGANIFDPKQEGAVSIALREIRQTTNDFVANKAKSVPVKESLKKQSSLYTALDNLAPKAADELDTAMGRAWQNTLKVLNIKTESIQAAATVIGYGGLGAMSLLSPYFTGALVATGAIHGGTKLILSPTGKRALATTLRYTDKAIRATRDKEILRQLRADRATMLEILQQSEQNQSNDQP